MKTSLLKGLDERQKEEVQNSFKAGSKYISQLAKIIEEKINSSWSSSRSNSEYSNPNWAYMQADSAGYERALKEVLSLLE